MTQKGTSTSNVTVQKRFTSGARRSLERVKIPDVDEENVYRMCIGGSTRVPDVHRWVKIRYGADPRAVHDHEPDIDRLHPHTVVINSFPGKGPYMVLLEPIPKYPSRVLP